ncbi:PLD nuclease N-terminal domain-containing protein [Microbacterium proteolyticum]|uniref:PLD nuclease N-terminal domain-containing protein n=1 Tax=Microbacterium proteolyticum TaxID=1572644 RepID=UPI001FAD3690|nr:PLD nuclease N-terminal domain-containing protein [Microbacterium proteolyticum]MCI9857769.1 PLDc_N domain-containing protein [Microbacterium proteolyticum]
MPVLALLTLIVMIIALIDAIIRREDQIKHMPKFVWVFFIVLLPLIGSILWFTLGREYDQRTQPMTFGDPRRWHKDTRSAPTVPPRDERTTEQQIADLEREMHLADLEEQARQRRTENRPLDENPGC